MKDTREAWERAGQGGRIDRRSLAERRDEAERAGDLEQAAELSRKPNVHLGPQAYRAGDLEREGRGEKKRGFGCGPTGWSRTIRRFGRSGTASSRGSKERIAGIYREASGAPGDMETTLAARDQWIELAKPTGDNRATRTRPRPQLALVYRIQQAPGHFMDNEDTRVPTVHIESGGPIIDDTQLEHWGDPMANIDPAAHPRPTNSHTTPSPSSIGFSKLRDTFMDNEDRLSLLSIKV